MTPCKTPSPLGRFLRDESGAVTVDWVVLTAGVMLLFLAFAFPIFYNSISDVSEHIAGQVLAARELAGD